MHAACIVDGHRWVWLGTDTGYCDVIKCACCGATLVQPRQTAVNSENR